SSRTFSIAGWCSIAAARFDPSSLIAGPRCPFRCYSRLRLSIRTDLCTSPPRSRQSSDGWAASYDPQSIYATTQLGQTRLSHRSRQRCGLRPISTRDFNQAFELNHLGIYALMSVPSTIRQSTSRRNMRFWHFTTFILGIVALWLLAPNGYISSLFSGQSAY